MRARVGFSPTSAAPRLLLHRSQRRERVGGPVWVRAGVVIRLGVSCCIEACGVIGATGHTACAPALLQCRVQAQRAAAGQRDMARVARAGQPCSQQTYLQGGRRFSCLPFHPVWNSSKRYRSPAGAVVTEGVEEQ